ncbi:phosphoglycerate mutase family protein [Stenotrophomonas pavanii]|uniref:phosphoglycerate mutase family protein n=1 Tax=Stenotrophomonas pavanii TaxID=487698 RepID=UPI002156368B|nr:phosphoglycerate mutase family protein [Stenotrophomonas pavanii]
MLRSIYLVRHGGGVSNAGGITMPHALVPLTEAGRKQADALSAQLPAQPPRILASPFVRPLDTAEPYAKQLQVKIEEQPLLQEFDMVAPALIAGMDQAQRRPIAIPPLLLTARPIAPAVLLGRCTIHRTVPTS